VYLLLVAVPVTSATSKENSLQFQPTQLELCAAGTVNIA
jgi:hypothetical protein